MPRSFTATGDHQRNSRTETVVADAIPSRYQHGHASVSRLTAKLGESSEEEEVEDDSSVLIGGAAIVFGFFHLNEWTETTRAIALAMGLLACFMEFLALGYGSKQWQLDTIVEDADLDARLQFLGAASTAATLTQLLWVSALFHFPLDNEAEDVSPKQVHEGEMTDEHVEDVENV